MKMRSIHINDDFGFIALQQDKYRECWFFHSKEQGEIILRKAKEDENINVCEEDVFLSSLPEKSDAEPLYIKGRAAETLSRLLSPIAEFFQGNPTVIFENKKSKPFLYFLLTPHWEDKEDSNALLGLRDDEENHFVFVVYSKKQGREILQSHFNKVQPEILPLAYKVLENSLLPEESGSSQVRINDPMAVFLNNGYVMIKNSGSHLLG